MTRRIGGDSGPHCDTTHQCGLYHRDRAAEPRNFKKAPVNTKVPLMRHLEALGMVLGDALVYLHRNVEFGNLFE
jgi:hypothetical protein